MNFLKINPYDFLLLGVFTGYLLAAILTWMVLNLYGLKGLLLGLPTNAIVHFTLIMSNELTSRARMPSSETLIWTILIFTLLNLAFSGGAYILMKGKRRRPELTAALGMFISSIFSWDLYIPALFALIVLLIPQKE